MQKTLTETYLDVCSDKENMNEHRLSKSPNIKTIQQSFVLFCAEKFRLTSKQYEIVIKKFSKTDEDKGGYILNRDKKKKIKVFININLSLVSQLGFIAHEMTHVKQIINNQLSENENGTHIVWNGVDFIDVETYNNIIDNIDKGDHYKAYRSLPWEIEAHQNQDTYLKEFKGSEYFDNLKKESDITMSLILDAL